MLPKLSWAVIVRLTPVPAVGVVLDAARTRPAAGPAVTVADSGALAALQVLQTAVTT